MSRAAFLALDHEAKQHIPPKLFLLHSLSVVRSLNTFYLASGNNNWPQSANQTSLQSQVSSRHECNNSFKERELGSSAVLSRRMLWYMIAFIQVYGRLRAKISSNTTQNSETIITSIQSYRKLKKR